MGKDKGACTTIVYRIRVQGILREKWADWFDDLTIIPQDNGQTVITGPVVDQAALYGILIRIRDLNLPLLLVERLEM